MESLKVKALHKLALNLGIPSLVTKEERINAFKLWHKLFAQMSAPGPKNVLSVDVGIKNFSFCKVTCPDLSRNRAEIHQWDHVNLHSRFGQSFVPLVGISSQIDTKAYLAHLAMNVVDEIFTDPTFAPNIITIENQRTRSNARQDTLPNVLMNFILEHMIYAGIAARKHQQHEQKQKQAPLANALVLPLQSRNMVNFWINRFLVKSKFKLAQSKNHRIHLLYGWLGDQEASPFSLDLAEKISPEFETLSLQKRNKDFLRVLNLDSQPKKVDDLVDCILYNLATLKQIQRYRQFQQAIREDGDLTQLVDFWEEEHRLWLKPLMRKIPDLELAPV